MQRPQFTIDEATEGDGDEFVGDVDEGGLMGEVDAMLQADEASNKGELSLSLCAFVLFADKVSSMQSC